MDRKCKHIRIFAHFIDNSARINKRLPTGGVAKECLSYNGTERLVLATFKTAIGP